MGRGLVNGLWPFGVKESVGRCCSIRRAGETDGLDVAAGIWGGANKGSSYIKTVSFLQSEGPNGRGTDRALKLGSFPSATLDNVVNADIGGAKKFLGSARSGARGIFAAAVAILVIAIRVGLAECSTVLG